MQKHLNRKGAQRSAGESQYEMPGGDARRSIGFLVFWFFDLLFVRSWWGSILLFLVVFLLFFFHYKVVGH